MIKRTILNAAIDLEGLSESNKPDKKALVKAIKNNSKKRPLG